MPWKCSEGRRTASHMDPSLRRGDGEKLKLNPESIDLATLRQLWQGADSCLDDAAMTRVGAAADSVSRIVARGETVYGVNTGFGLLANQAIPADRLAELQT